MLEQLLKVLHERGEAKVSPKEFEAIYAEYQKLVNSGSEKHGILTSTSTNSQEDINGYGSASRSSTSSNEPGGKEKPTI